MHVDLFLKPLTPKSTISSYSALRFRSQFPINTRLENEPLHKDHQLLSLMLGCGFKELFIVGVA